MSKQPFVTDIKALRERARRHIEQGAVTEGYQADRETVIKICNEALATEIVCVLRYKRHYFMAEGINAESVATEFAEHAAEEQAHADRIAHVRLDKIHHALQRSDGQFRERNYAGVLAVKMLF